jgi:hypothetical protein
MHVTLAELELDSELVSELELSFAELEDASELELAAELEKFL